MTHTPNPHACPTAQATGAALGEQKRVAVMIPAECEGDSCAVDVGINGYFYRIARGRSVEVPESVAALLHAAAYI